MPRLLPSIVLLCLVSFPSLACRSAATLPPDGNRTQEDHAPTPFSAEEIRRACPQGRWNLFETAHPGKPRSYQLTTFTKVDEDGAELEAVNVDEEGERIGEVYRKSATWIGARVLPRECHRDLRGRVRDARRHSRLLVVRGEEPRGGEGGDPALLVRAVKAGTSDSRRADRGRSSGRRDDPPRHGGRPGGRALSRDYSGTATKTPSGMSYFSPCHISNSFRSSRKSRRYRIQSSVPVRRLHRSRISTFRIIFPSTSPSW